MIEKQVAKNKAYTNMAIELINLAYKEVDTKKSIKSVPKKRFLSFENKSQKIVPIKVPLQKSNLKMNLKNKNFNNKAKKSKKQFFEISDINK